MPIKVQMITEFELPDLTGDGKTDLTDIATIVSMLGDLTPELHVQLRPTTIDVSVINTVPLIDLTGDKKVDLTDIVRFSGMIAQATAFTKVTVVQ